MKIEILKSKFKSNQGKGKRCLNSDHMIRIAHTEPRPDELENRIQEGPFNKIKFLNQYCAK